MYRERTISIHTAFDPIPSSLAPYDQSAECNQAPAPPPALAAAAALSGGAKSPPPLPSSRTAQCPQRHSEQEVDPQGLEERSHVWTAAEVSECEGSWERQAAINKRVKHRTVAERAKTAPLMLHTRATPLCAESAANGIHVGSIDTRSHS